MVKTNHLLIFHPRKGTLLTKSIKKTKTNIYKAIEYLKKSVIKYLSIKTLKLIQRNANKNLKICE